MLKSSARRYYSLFLLTTAVGFNSYLGLTLGAQEEDSLDAYELSPFEVTTDADNGYLSTNSTSGTSLNMAIKDLPMSIQVINQDFIKDLGAGDLEESLAYSAGVFTSDNQASSSVGATRGGGSGDKSISSAGSSSRFANVVHIRGLPTPYQNRMGFRYGGLVVTPNSAIALGGLLDTANIERIEVVKGPNSLLYGVGVLSGIVNVIPEKPLSEPRYELGLKLGSYDYFRSTFDFTGPVNSEIIPGELNWRLAGSYEEKGGWTDFSEKETQYWVAQLDYTPVKALNIFLEYQDGYTRYDGIGSTWIYDQISSANDTEFRNEYDEAYNWARHEGTIEGLRSLEPTGYNFEYNTINDNNESRKLPGFKLSDTAFAGGDLPDSYRITGPDTFAERDEQNFLADMTLTPVEGLTINAGAFISKQDTEELNLKFRNTSTTVPSIFYSTINTDDQLQDIFLSGGVYGRQMQQSVKDLVNASRRVDSSVHGGTDEDYILPGVTDDVKLTEYWWERNMVKSQSEQYRLRATYTFEADIFGRNTTHTFLAGFSYLHDDIDFPDGNLNAGNAKANSKGGSALQYNEDGLYYRSIANFDPLYLDGRNDGVAGHNVVRGGDAFLNQKITQEGYYGVYHGKFFEDKLEVIMGLRHDQYNATQATYKRADITDELLRSKADDAVDAQALATARALTHLTGSDPILRMTDEYINELANLTSQETYIAIYYRDAIESGNEGYFGYANRGGAPDESYGFVEGSEFQIFKEDVEVTTGTIGLSYNINDNFTIYGVAAQGISPNTALRDGAGEIIPAEETFNKEIGIKFDLFEGKLSGSLALFQIERKNAIWDVGIAPAAAKWADAQLSSKRSGDWTPSTFDPSSPSIYMVEETYFKQFLSDVFNVDPAVLDFGREGDQLYQNYLDPNEPNIGLALKKRKEIKEATISSFGVDYFPVQPFSGEETINYGAFSADGFDDLHQLTVYDPASDTYITKGVSNLAILYAAFMDRELDKEKYELLDRLHPVRYRRLDSGGIPQGNNNVSFDQSQGALVTFDENINGFEMELFYSPLPNLQFVLGYTHTEREAENSFDFTEWESITGGDVSFIPPFTMLHREFGWNSAGIQVAWIDADIYSAALSGAGGDVLSAATIAESAIEFIPEAEVDNTIGNDEFVARHEAGQILVFVDKRGNFINETNSARATDYEGLLSGVSLNFNPEDEFTFWGKYTFDKSGPEWLERLSLTAGMKYVGPSATSVAFRSVSPLNDLTVTPEVADRFTLDLGFSYLWDWGNVGMRLSFNASNVLNETYEVTTTTLGIPNPITGESITKRTEKFYSPTTYRIGLSASF